MTTPEPTHTTDEVLRRVQGEFLEMPGLRLTEAQARRLWGLDRDDCAALLGALVDTNFLFQTRDGAFMRNECSTAEGGPDVASGEDRRRAAATHTLSSPEETARPPTGQ